MLSKYTDEEIIELARLNPGYGILRMVSELYPRKKSKGSSNRDRIANDIIFILQEHKEESGEDLFELLQSTEFSTKVTEAEYLRRTGRNRLPKGRGRGTGSRLSRAQGGGYHTFIELPPQEFNWGEIMQGSERDAHAPSLNPLREYSILNLHHPFREYWEMWMDGYSRAEIAREHDGNNSTVGKWVNLMIEIDNEEGLEEWLEIVELLNFFVRDRGHSNYEESRNDMVIQFVQSISNEFVTSPNTVERIEPKELVEAYRFACENEEGGN